MPGQKPDLPPYAPSVEHFLVDRGVVFLNHGSFGSTPRDVLAEQERLRAHVEREPVRFFVEELEGLLDDARVKVAGFVGCPPDDLAFVTNATEGVSTVARSLNLAQGDVLVSGSHEYNACHNALTLAAERAGCALVTLNLPCPVSDPHEVVEAVVAGVKQAMNRGRVRLLLLSHITSPSGIVLPAAEIIQQVQALGVDVLLDSAHAPGFIPYNITALAPAYSTANLHKWCCGPKGSAILYVRPDRQPQVRPLIISHGANSPRIDRSRFRLEFDMTGSRDYSPWLAAPLAITLVGGMGGSEEWPAVMRSNRVLAMTGGEALAGVLGKWGEGRTLAPGAMLAAMRALTLPEPKAALRTGRGVGPSRYHDPLQDRLLESWKVQVPVHSVPLTDGRRQRVLRISAMLYNTPAQYDYLAHALEHELTAEGC